jgi:hypothetical protein
MRKDEQDNASQIMKVGNDVDTTEMRRAVQIEKPIMSSPWEPIAKVQSRPRYKLRSWLRDASDSASRKRDKSGRSGST